MKKGLIVLGVVILVLLAMGGSCTGKYNQLVTLNENVDTAWSQVENVLQRRNDLIPNLVNTVKGYAAHEQKIFIDVAKARSQVGQAKTIPQKIGANNQLTGALSRLLLVVERYPDLKANQNFLALQDELAGTENRIAVERKRYNDAVRAYNTFVRKFPNNMIAGIFGYSRKNVYFKADESAKNAPVVSFGNTNAAPVQTAPSAKPAPTTGK